MESPVRSIETSSGENVAQTAGSKEGEAAEGTCPQQQQRQFEAKSYLERQVEKLSCADEEEAQEKVSKAQELKHERARKKR